MSPTLKSRLVAPVLGALFALVACAPFLPPIGSPFPQSASASPASGPSQAELIARQSVYGAGTVNSAAQFGEMVPGVSVAATYIDHVSAGYLEEIKRQIAGLDERTKQGHQNSPQDWVWAMAFAGLAGGANVFSFKHGQRSAAGAAPGSPTA
jgi:hypothetical protein